MEKRKRILIVGWDGASFDIIHPMLKAGKMPTVQKLMEHGSYGRLRSTIPPITAPAWCTLLNGMNPGKHGVYWFKELKRDEKNFVGFGQVIDSRRIAGRTFLDVLSAEHYKVLSHLVPMTYPAWPLNGVMVSGGQLYGPEYLEKRYYPREVGTLLKEREFISSDGRRESEIWANLKAHRDVAFQLLEHTIQKDLANILTLLESYEWDVCMAYFTDPDCVQHTYWDFIAWNAIAGDYRESDFGTAIFRIYQRLDDALSEILAHVPDETIVLIISDHGAQKAPDHYFFINHFLKTRGLLKIKPLGVVAPFIWKVFNNRFLSITRGHGVLQNLTNHYFIDWKCSKAYGIWFSWLTGGIYLKTEGSVEYERMRKNLIDELLMVKDPLTGKSVFEEVWKCEEVWIGPDLENAPDIVFNIKEHYMLNFLLSGCFVDSIRREVIGGGHGMEGILIASSKNYDSPLKPHQEIASAHLADIMPTILYYLGIPIPSYVDGRVITDLFREDFVNATPIRVSEAPYERKSDAAHIFSKEEIKKIEDRLKGLGYID